MGGGGGGAEGPASNLDVDGDRVDEPAMLSGLGVLGDFFSSMADRGRGGPMVPNSIEANCFALPPVGRSSSSSEESFESSTTDHSSSSGRTRDGRAPVGEKDGAGTDLVWLSC